MHVVFIHTIDALPKEIPLRCVKGEMKNFCFFLCIGDTLGIFRRFRMRKGYWNRAVAASRLCCSVRLASLANEMHSQGVGESSVAEERVHEDPGSFRAQFLCAFQERQRLCCAFNEINKLFVLRSITCV